MNLTEASTIPGRHSNQLKREMKEFGSDQDTKIKNFHSRELTSTKYYKDSVRKDTSISP
ncbi:hypothetical protein K3495_g5253 [Podosphaera aphanis]|nr:hypothetical protein K3495_g5253 [Podosphaera aphanis]